MNPGFFPGGHVPEHHLHALATLMVGGQQLAVRGKRKGAPRAVVRWERNPLLRSLSQRRGCSERMQEEQRHQGMDSHRLLLSIERRNRLTDLSQMGAPWGLGCDSGG